MVEACPGVSAEFVFAHNEVDNVFRPHEVRFFRKVEIFHLVYIVDVHAFEIVSRCRHSVDEIGDLCAPRCRQGARRCHNELRDIHPFEKISGIVGYVFIPLVRGIC